MPQLPSPGADWQVWGGELVAFLRVALADPNGTLLAPVLLAGSHASAPLGRVIAGGTGITIADAGAGSALTISMSVDGSTIELAGGAIRIKDSGVVSAKLANGSVIAAKIPDGEITYQKLAGSIPLSKLAFSGDVTKFIRADGTEQPIPTTVGVPTGMCLPWASNTPPAGTAYLVCDGAAVSRTTYATLFGVIGVEHGVGDGTTTFNLPDYRGRMLVGKGTHVDVNTVAKSDAAAVANRRPKHQHTVYDPQHKHTFSQVEHNTAQSGTSKDSNLTQTADTSFASTGVKVNPEGTSSSSSPQDAPAYSVVTWVIKT